MLAANSNKTVFCSTCDRNPRGIVRATDIYRSVFGTRWPSNNARDRNRYKVYINPLITTKILMCMPDDLTLYKFNYEIIFLRNTR